MIWWMIWCFLFGVLVGAGVVAGGLLWLERQ